MLSHADIWRAIDGLAAQQNLSASALARRAGLDPTSFNKSKRVTKDGKQRWPSTESVAKVLNGTDTSMTAFVKLIETGGSVAARQIPSITLDQARRHGRFDAQGRPTGPDWDEILLPHLDDAHIYALEIDDERWQPDYRAGDVLVISPEASLRRGDLLAVKLSDGAVAIGRLLRQSARAVELDPIGQSGPTQSFDPDRIAWTARIVWVSR